MMRSDETSAGYCSSASSSSATWFGVTWITVTLCRSSSRTASTGSKYSCITSLAPIPSVAPSTQIRPALQKSG